MRQADSITLPRGLAKAIIQAAYWPAITADLLESVGEIPDLPLIGERRQEALDDWLCDIGTGLKGDLSSERMLQAVMDAWARGSRPWGAK